MRWAYIIITTIIVVVVGYAVYQKNVVNPAVAEEVRTQPDGVRAQRVMLMTIDGSYTLPVNYLHEDDVVYVGADGPWWRELIGEEGMPVTLLMKGKAYSGRARAILKQPEFTRQVFERLRPAVPGWIPDLFRGVLVQIDLDPGTGAEGEMPWR